MTKNFLRGYHPWFNFFPYDNTDADVFMSKFGGASFAANIDGLSFWSYAGYDWNYGVTINCWPGSDTGASILANNQYTGPGQRKYINSGLPERFSFADQYYNRGIRFNGRSTTDGENTFPEASLAFSVIDTLGDVYIHAPEEWWGLYATNQSSKIPYTTAYKNPDTWPELQGKKWKKFLMVGGGWVGLTTNGELWSVINRISNSDTRIDIRDSQPEVWKSGLSWNYRHSRNISPTDNEFENSSGFKVVNKLGNYGLANYSFKVLHSSPINNIVYTNQINTYQPQRIYNYYDEKLVIQGTANEVYDQINALLISKGVNLPANPGRRLSGKNYENLLPLIAQKLGYDRASVVQTDYHATTGYVTTSTDGENFTVVDSGTFVDPNTSNPATLIQLIRSIAEANRGITGIVFEGKSVPYKDIYINTDVRGNCSVYAIAEDNTVYVWGHTGGDGSSPIESDHRIGKKQNGDKFNARLDGPVASNLGGGKGLRDIGMTADGGVCWGIDGDDHLVIWSIATEGNPVVYSQHQIEKIIHWDTNLGGPTGASTRSDLNGFIILTKDTHEIVVMNNVFNTLSKWPSSRGVYIENDSNATAYTTSHNTDYNRWEVGTVRKSDFDSDRSPGLIQYIQGGPVDQWVDIAYSSSTFGTNYQRASFDVVDNQGRVFKIYNIRFEDGNLRYFYRQLYNNFSASSHFEPSRDFRFDGAYGRQFLKAFSQNAGPNNEYDLAVAPAIIRAAQNTPFPTPEASKPATEPPPPPPPEPTTEPLLTYLLGAPSAKACFSLSNEGYSIPLDVIKPINSELKVGDRVRSSESEYLNHENLIKLLDPAKSFDDPVYLRSSKIKTLTYPSLPNDDFIQYTNQSIVNNRPIFLTEFTDGNGIGRDFKAGHARSIHKFQDSKLGVKIKDLHAANGSSAFIQIKSRWGLVDTEFSNSHYYTQLTHHFDKTHLSIHKIIWDPDAKKSINTKLFGIDTDPNVNGKTLYLETIGNKITAYIDETEIGSVTDSDIAGSGVSSVLLLEYDSNLDNVAEIDGIELIADRKSPTVYKLEKDLEGGFPYSKIVSVNACDDFVEALSADDISLGAEIPQPVPDEGIVPDGGISGGRFNINYTDNRHIYTFNRSGKLFVGTDSETNTFDILSIGGGGGGGANRGGGGGAGGLVKKTITLDSGYYDVHVGQGGRPGANGRHTKLIKENVLLDHDFIDGDIDALKLRNGTYTISLDGKLQHTRNTGGSEFGERIERIQRLYDRYIMTRTLDNEFFNGYVEADVFLFGAGNGIGLVARSQATSEDYNAYIAHTYFSTSSTLVHSIWTGVDSSRPDRYAQLHAVSEVLPGDFSAKIKLSVENNRLRYYVNDELKIDIDNNSIVKTNGPQFNTVNGRYFTKDNSILIPGKFGIRINAVPTSANISTLKIVETKEVLRAHGGGAGGSHNSYGYPLHGQDGGSGGGGSLNYWAGSEELSNVDPRSGTALIDCNQDNHKQLLPGQKLLSGQKLYTNNGTYELVMLPDGNLMERKGRQVVWQTNTSGNAGAFATVTYDGRLVVVLGENVLFETSTSNTAGSKLILKESGELVLFNPDGLQNFDSENLLPGGLHAMWYGGGMAQGGGARYESPSDEKMLTGQFWFPYSNPYITTNISYPSNWPTAGGIDDNYGYTAWGYFKPPVDGFYQFRTQSDDGSAVWLGPQAAWCNFTADVNNGLILDNNRLGRQEPTVKDSDVIYLEKNRAYPIRIIHREVTGGDRMLFQWKGSSYDETMTTGEHINSSAGSLGWNNDLSQYFYRSAVPENFGIDCFTYETWSNGVDDGSLLGAVDKQGNDGEASGYSDNNPRSTGGGGGAGGSGVGGSIDNNPDGGIGLAFDFMGEEVYYAGGGGGAKEQNADYAGSDNGRGGFGGGGNGGAANVGADGLGGGGGGGASGADGGRGGDGLFQLSFVSNNIIPIPNTVVEGGDRTEYVKDGKTFAVHTFTESSTLDIQSVNPNNTFDMLVVAGGGGGGNIGEKGGGGGGGGGVIYLENNILEAGSYSIVVGSGGARDRQGGNSSITNTHSDFSLVAVGGGRGAQGEGESAQTGGSGGSGGGGGFKHSNSGGSGTAGQGFSGGRASNGHYVAGGGGGGAGGNGGSAVRNPLGGFQAGGPGGPGREIAIDGVNKYYAGGGAGHGQHGQNIGGEGGGGNTSVAGRSGTGGGGGAGSSGGSGIVIISYEVLAEIPQITPSPTATITSTATATPAETPDSTPAETPPSTPRETPSQTNTPSDPVRGYWYYISDELKDICYTNQSKRILVYNFTYRGIQLSPGDLLVKRDFTDNPVDEDYWSWSELTELVKAPHASYLYISYVDLSVFDEERISYVVQRTSNGFAAIAQAASVCPTPTSTPTVSFSSTPDATATPTSSITHTPTRTASRTPSNTPEESPKATPTTTPPNTPSHTQTPTNTATHTVTATNTSTPTTTVTQTSTYTQTPTASITPSDGARRYQYYISDDHLELCQAPNISSDPPADGLISQLNKTAYSAELTGWENRAEGPIGKLMSVYDADNGIYESSDLPFEISLENFALTGGRRIGRLMPENSNGNLELQAEVFNENEDFYASHFIGYNTNKNNTVSIDVHQLDVDVTGTGSYSLIDLYVIDNYVSGIANDDLYKLHARVINYGGDDRRIQLYRIASTEYTGQPKALTLVAQVRGGFDLPSEGNPKNFTVTLQDKQCKVFWDEKLIIDYEIIDGQFDLITNARNLVYVQALNDSNNIIIGKDILVTGNTESSTQSHWFLEEQPIKDNSINIDVYEIDVDTPGGAKRKSVDLYAIHNSSISFHVFARLINYGGGDHRIQLYKYESGKFTVLKYISGSQFNLPSLSSPVNFRFEMYNLHCKVYWDNRKVIDYVLEDTNLDTSSNIQNVVHIYHHQDTTRILTGEPRLKTIVSKETKLTVDTDTRLLTINDIYTPGGIFRWDRFPTYRPVAAVEISRFDWEFENNIYDNKSTTDGSDDELFQPVDTAKLMILKNEFGSRPFVGIWLCNDNWQRVSNLTNLYKGNVNYTRLQDYIANTKLSNSNVILDIGYSYTNNNTFERITGETAETNDKYWTNGLNIYDRFDTSRGSQEGRDLKRWVRWLQDNENDTYSLDISNSLSGLGDEARAYKVVYNSMLYTNTNPNNTISIDLYNMNVTDHINGVADEYGLKPHYKYIDLYNRLTWWPTDNRTPTGAVVYRYYHIFTRFINYGNTNPGLPPRLLMYTYDTFRNARPYRILADSYYAGGNYRYTARPDMPLPTQDDPVKFSFTIIGNYLSAYWNDNLILDYTMTDADINHEDPAFNEAVFDDSRFFMRRQQISAASINNKEPLLISKPTVYTHNNLQLNNNDINFNSLPTFWAFNEKEQGSRYDLNELVVKSDWTPPSPPTSFFDFTELQERANSNADTLYMRKTIENYDEVAPVAEIKANTQAVLGPVGKAIISDIPELCPTPTPTPTHSQTPTYSPTYTPPGTPTQTQTPTKTATATQTPTKTTTPTYTPSETNYPDREIFFWGQNLSDYDYDTIDSVQQGMPIVFGDVSVTRNRDGYLINGTQITSSPPLRAPDNIFVASSIIPRDDIWEQSGLLDLVRSDLSGSVNVIFSVYKHTFESDNDTKEYENGIRMIVLQTGWSLETNRRNNTYQLIDINYTDHQQIWNALEEYFGVTFSRLWTDDPKDIILTKYDFAPVENDTVDAPFKTETQTIVRDIIQPLTNIIAGSYGQLAPNNTLELTTDRTESTYIQSHYSIDNQKVNSELSVDISDLSINPDQRFPGQTNQFAFIDLYLVQNDKYSIVARMINSGRGNHSLRLVTRPIRSFNDKTLQTFTGFDLPSVDNPINLRVKITDYNICQIYFNNALVIQYTLTDDDRYRFDNLYTSNNTSMVNIMVAGAAGRIALQGRPELKVTDSAVQSNVILLNENVQQIDSEFKNIVWKKVLPIFLSPKIGVTFGIANNQIYAWGGSDTDTTDRANTNLYPAIIKNSEELNNQEVLDIDYGYSDLNDYFLYILTKDDTGNRALYTLDISVGNQDLEISEIIISNISSNVLSKVDLDQFNFSRDEITTYINVNNLQEDFPATYPGTVGRPLRIAQLNIPKILKPTVDLDILGMSAIRSDGRRYYMSDRARSDTPIPDFHVIDYDRSSYQEIFVLVNGAYVDRFGEEILTDLDRLKECDLLYYYKDTSKFINTISGAYELKTFDEILDSSVNAYYSKPISKTIVAVRGMGFTNTDGEYVPPVPFYTHRDSGSRIDHIGYAFSKPSPYVSKGLFEPAVGFIPLGPDSADMMSNIDSFEIYRSPDLDYEPDQIHKRNLAEWDDRKKNKDKEIFDTFVIKAACGNNFFFMIDNTGDAYSWGDNRNGQLGIGANANVERRCIFQNCDSEPRLIENYKFKDINIFRGNWNDHIAYALTLDGQPLYWGSNIGDSPQLMAEDSGYDDYEFAGRSFHPSPTPTPSFTPTPSVSISLTPTNSVTPTNTPTYTSTNTQTPSFTPTHSVTPTFTPTHTSTISNTPSVTATHTPTRTVTPTFTEITAGNYYYLDDNEDDLRYERRDYGAIVGVESTNFAEGDTLYRDIESNTKWLYNDLLTFLGKYITPQPTQTMTPTKTNTPTPSVTSSVTPSNSATPTATPTNTATSTVTPSYTASVTQTETPPSTATPTASVTASYTSTPTNTITHTNTASYTPSNTPTITNTITNTKTQTPTISPTATDTTGSFSFDITAQSVFLRNVFALPLVSNGEYDFIVNYGDGSSSQRITNSNFDRATHIYFTPGTYRVSIRGIIKGWSIQNTPNVVARSAKESYGNVYSWGDLEFIDDVSGMFAGCSNLNILASDAPKIGNTLEDAFANCDLTNSANVENWDISRVANMRSVFLNTNIDINLANWNISSLTNATNFMAGCTLSTTNYDNILKSWQLLAQDNVAVNIHFGNSRYTANSQASFGRDTLTSAPYNWTITDGGTA